MPKFLQILALLSGFGSVVYEVLYMRHLTNLLGDMYYVHAALLGTFLLGIGVGSKIAHRFRPHLWLFEGVIGVYAIAFPTIVALFERSPLHGLVGDPVWQTVLSTALILGVPATAIGFSVPLFSTYLEEFSEAENGFFDTYFVYNLGACVSILIFELWVIRQIGYDASLRTLGTVNLLVAAALFVNRGQWQPAPHRQTPPTPVWDRSVALFLASLGAAVFHSFYLKLAYHLFSPHRQNFAICTSAVLLGMALGTDLVGRRGWTFRTSIVGAVLSMGAVYVGYPAIEWLYHAAPPTHFLEAVGTKLVFAMILGGLPYVFLGATIPALVGEDEGDTAFSAGHFLFLSGIANALGFVLYLFVLHPSLPFFGVLAGIGGLLAAALGVDLWRHGLPEPGPRLQKMAAATGLGFALLGATLWVSDSEVYLPTEGIPQGASVEHHKSASDNVTVIRKDADNSVITYNGHPSIRVKVDGHPNLTEVVSGLLPSLWAPSLERALVLGLGSGLTGGTTATVFDRTDIVELNGAFIDLLPQLADSNFHVASNPGARVIHDDARRYLTRTDRTYDAIINSIPSPTYFSAGKIYTVEFFDRVKRALRPGGTYSTWFSFGNTSPQGIRTLLGTLSSRFEHCNLTVLKLGYYFATCSDEPLERRPLFAPGGRDDRATQRAAVDPPLPVQATLSAQIPEIGPEREPKNDLKAYLEAIVLSRDIFAQTRFVDAQLNRDEFPVLEFQIMKFKGSGSRMSIDVLDFLDRLNLQIDIPDPRTRRARFLHRALIYKRLHPPIFEEYFKPKLKADAELQAAFDERLETTADRRAKGDPLSTGG